MVEEKAEEEGEKKEGEKGRMARKGDERKKGTHAEWIDAGGMMFRYLFSMVHKVDILHGESPTQPARRQNLAFRDNRSKERRSPTATKPISSPWSPKSKFSVGNRSIC
jgi:hypothetical protein